MKIKPWSRYPIHPEHIDVDRPFISAFGSAEAEEVARAIVRHSQRQDNWVPLSVRDVIKNFTKMKNFVDNVVAIIKGIKLLEENFYLENDEQDNQVFYVNERFIDRCHAASPVNKKV